MEHDWKNKVLLITGASKGIGATVIKLALAEGVQQVFNLDIDEKNGVKLQNELNEEYGEGKVKFMTCDVTSEEQLKTNFELVLGDKNKNYVVINNAGICNDSKDAYRKEIEINVTAVVTGSLLALDLIRKDKGGNGGTIINISSVAALSPRPCVAIYNATKSAVLTFSICLGADDYYKPSGVRVLTICFGPTRTGILFKENMGSFDSGMNNYLPGMILNTYQQSVDSAGCALIEAFKRGESASVWLAFADKPVEDITDSVRRAYGVLAEPLKREL